MGIDELFKSAAQGEVMTLSELINNGVSFIKRDSNYKITPIDVAMHNCHVDTTGKLLLQHGAVYFNNAITLKSVLNFLMRSHYSSVNTDGFLLTVKMGDELRLIYTLSDLKKSLQDENSVFPNLTLAKKQFENEISYHQSQLQDTKYNRDQFFNCNQPRWQKHIAICQQAVELIQEKQDLSARTSFSNS